MMKARRSFTLVETLVAVAILSIVIVGPLYDATRAYAASNVARNQLTASLLAQEGAEYIRSIRDGNYLYSLDNPAAPRAWLYGLSACLPGPCTVDPTQAPPSDIGTQLTPLYISTNSLYTQLNSIDTSRTLFFRQASIVTVSSNEVKVTVTVTWRDEMGSHSVVVNDYLDNWL